MIANPASGCFGAKPNPLCLSTHPPPFDGNKSSHVPYKPPRPFYCLSPRYPPNFKLLNNTTRSLWPFLKIANFGFISFPCRQGRNPHIHGRKDLALFRRRQDPRERAKLLAILKKAEKSKPSQHVSAKYVGLCSLSPYHDHYHRIESWRHHPVYLNCVNRPAAKPHRDVGDPDLNRDRDRRRGASPSIRVPTMRSWMHLRKKMLCTECLYMRFYNEEMMPKL